MPDHFKRPRRQPPERIQTPISLEVEQAGNRDAQRRLIPWKWLIITGIIAAIGLISIVSFRIASSYISSPPVGEEPMIRIPAGEVQIRRAQGEGYRTAFVKAFWMDAHEVTVGDFKQFVEETGYDTTDMDWSIINKISPTDEHPMVRVSWKDAQAYAKWAKKELPTREQWLYAAHGGGSSGPLRVSQQQRLAGGKYYANYDSGPSNPDGYQYAAPVGRFPANSFGLYDMLGNVAEWCDEHTPDGERFVCGGSWVDSITQLDDSGWRNFPPNARFRYIGFRCVRRAKDEK